MEILILGVLLVVIMVIVSTRVKKNAARAFEPETIENREFKLQKPSGLMYPIRDDSKFAFEAYSNTFGDGNLRSIWQIHSDLTIHTDSKFKSVCNDAKKIADEIFSEEFPKDKPKDQRICLIEGENTDDGVKKRIFWKIIESLSQQKVYEFKISVLDIHLAENLDKASEMFESFTVK